MVVVSGYITSLSKEYEVTELKCTWQDATRLGYLLSNGNLQYTAIHHLLLCGTDFPCIKSKIAIVEVNLALLRSYAEERWVARYT